MIVMTQGEFTKLFKDHEEKLGRHFDKIDKKLDKVDHKFDVVDFRFDAHDRQLDKVNEELSKKFDEVLKSLDGLAKLITDYHQEMLMLAHKVDRLEKWIHEIAEKTGVKLSYK